MVISIAMLGIGTAGTILALFSRLKNIANIAAYAALAGISIIVGYIVSNNIFFDPVKLSWDRTQIFYIAIYCLVLSIPFFFSGILVATAFSTQSEKSEHIYSTDLLGAGIGSLCVLGLLNIGGPEYAIFTASLLCFIASFTSGKKKVRWLASLLIVVNALLLIIHPYFINIKLSPYKTLSLSLKYPGAQHLKTYYNSFSRIDSLKSPAVRFAPGLSLTYLEPLPEQIGLSIDGSEMNAVTKSDNKNALRFLSFLPSALAYEIKVSHPPHPDPLPQGEREVSKESLSQGERKHNKYSPPLMGGGKEGENILIIDPKGGLQALIAEYYGFKNIHKVESNPLLIKIIKTDFKEFSGNIFKNNIWTGFGRSYLRSSRLTAHGSQPYDIIDLPMTGTAVSSAFGISEDYRFTVEAFKEYFGALNKTGFLNISLYLIPPPRTELRLLVTIIDALLQTGITDASKHIAAIRSWDSITILAKKSSFNLDEIKSIKEFCRDKRFDLVYYPKIKEQETNLYVRLKSNEYFNFFRNIINPETRELFIKDYLFDITPVYDDNPFFNYYLKLKNIKVIYDIMGHKWQYFIEEGYLLPLIFLQVLILSVILIVLPVFFKRARSSMPKKQLEQFELFKPFKRYLMLPTLLYFAMLGLGFMFVEVTMIQKSILSLGNPAYAVATALTAILISSGVGSLLSSNLFKLKTLYFLPLLGGLIFLYSLMYPLFLNLISPYSLELKIPLVFISLIPPGFFMGIPFPAGMKLLGQKNEALIPWAWAVNGCLSVLAPVLTIMLAMTAGFKFVLYLGALAYMVAFVSLWKMTKAQSYLNLTFQGNGVKYTQKTKGGAAHG